MYHAIGKIRKFYRYFFDDFLDFMVLYWNEFDMGKVRLTQWLCFVENFEPRRNESGTWGMATKRWMVADQSPSGTFHLAFLFNPQKWNLGETVSEKRTLVSWMNQVV